MKQFFVGGKKSPFFETFFFFYGYIITAYTKKSICCDYRYIIFLFFFFRSLLTKWIECSSMVRETGSNPDRVIPKTLEMVPDAASLNTEHYKVQIKDKVEQSRERSSALLNASVVYLIKSKPSVHSRLRSPTLLFLLYKKKVCFVD